MGAPWPSIADLAGSGCGAEAARRALARISAHDGELNAALSTLEPDEEDGRSGGVGPLAGVPVAIKDNICLDRGVTTAGSRMLEGYRSPFEATAAARLRGAGAALIAKANLDEFAMGSTGENSAFGPTRNPWDLTRVPGGSSSGAAAAVAAGFVPGALGSDTGGSIRQPAGWCNLVGIKPTYGRVSRLGLVAFASSLDQIGTLTRTVADGAALLSEVCGFDAGDSTSLDAPAEDFTKELERPIERARIGVAREARSRANHPGVVAAIERAVGVFEGGGAEIVEIDLPHSAHGIAAYYIIACAEASSNLARYDGVRYGRRGALEPGESVDDLYFKSRTEGLGREVQRRIILGTYVLSAGYYDAYFATAMRARRLIRRDFDAVFGREGGDGRACDAILLPTSPGPAPRLGEKTADPLTMYLEDVYTVGVNLAGLPAVSVPGGFAAAGEAVLPVGVQLIGPAMSEARLLRLARRLEEATRFFERPCPFWSRL